MPTYQSPGVYVEEVPAGSRPIEGVGTAVAAFVGLAADGPFNSPTLVTNWSQFSQTFGGFIEGSFLAHSVYGYFNNGGGAAYIVRIGDDGASDTPAASAELTSAANPELVTYQATARDAGPAGNNISVEITDVAGDDDEGAFNLVVKVSGQPRENFENLSTRKGGQNVVTVVNEQSQLIELVEVGSASVADRRPASATTFDLAGGGLPVPVSMSPTDYVGDVAERSGLGGLEAIETITMVAAPDLMAAYQAGLIDLEGVQAVQTAMIAHCENMGNRIAVLDSPPGLNAQQVSEWRVDRARYDSAYATLYWPWVKVLDPLSGQNTFVPPSGHMAGIWGRSDDTRGVHKAPANEVVRGAVDIEVAITRAEHDQLNPDGINVIRSFPGQGIRVWGARTLSSDPAWRYLNVRRLFNYVESSILNGTQWVVFEPNDFDLWQRVRRTISAFLTGVWRDGALFGLTPDQAFYVKCDFETNPPDSIDAGYIITEIGIAPVKPAEFVVFRIAQLSAGGDGQN